MLSILLSLLLPSLIIRQNEDILLPERRGIYATRLADFLGVTIRNDDIELPPAYLDFNAMVHHQFFERNESPL